MPLAHYLPEKMGSITLTPAGPFVAGTYQELRLVYTAGLFGVDDTGMLKIVWRTTSDFGKPQFDQPSQPGYTTIVASNGAKLEHRVDRLSIRPWSNTLLIRVGRGFLRAGETITITLGDRARGSPGIRMQTNVEDSFELKVLIDAFATYEFTELPHSPEFALVAGPPVRWNAILPSLVVAGEPFRLCLMPEDIWGNPTAETAEELVLEASTPIAGLPARAGLTRGRHGLVIEGLRASFAGDVTLRVLDRQGRELTRANPMRVVEKAQDAPAAGRELKAQDAPAAGGQLKAQDAPAAGRQLKAQETARYWGDLHGQSEETVGTNSANDYFAFARDKSFIDIAGHQGNDFQVTDAFWAELNRLTAAYEAPGKFLAIPGYEWSGNTGMGGDRNVFYRREGRPIHRSSQILIEDTAAENTTHYRADALFDALRNEDAIVIAHVGGRYADIAIAHDGRIERAVEVHSTWGTFEWLAHDAFANGYRIGIVAHSDDHKGRQGAARPGASTFGAVGGLTCYLMPELTRDAWFSCVRARHHYGTTGVRLFLDVRGKFEKPVTRFDDDPTLGATGSRQVSEVSMGDIVRPGPEPMTLAVDVIGTAPVERIDVLVGARVVHTARNFSAADCRNRIRVLWEGAEYRGRGRETVWNGKLHLTGARFARHASVNFLNPERAPREIEAGSGLAWTSVTTGNRAGLDLWLDDGSAGTLAIETNVVSGRVELGSLGDTAVEFDGGGLARKLSVYRLPDAGAPRRLSFTLPVSHTGGHDSPVWVRVTQEDGNQAWSSPIYLID